jgi:Mn-dependent DtxR family transcriptional regulator
MDKLLKHFSPSVANAIAELIDQRVEAEVERRVEEFKVRTYTKAEACKVLNTCRNGLIEYEEAGMLQGFKKGARKVLYTHEALQECLRRVSDPHWKQPKQPAKKVIASRVSAPPAM